MLTSSLVKSNIKLSWECLVPQFKSIPEVAIFNKVDSEGLVMLILLWESCANISCVRNTNKIVISSSVKSSFSDILIISFSCHHFVHHNDFSYNEW